MPAKKEPVISVEFIPNSFVHLNYYQVSTVVVKKNNLEEVTEVEFTMTNSKIWNFADSNAAWAYSQYQKIVNKEND